MIHTNNCLAWYTGTPLFLTCENTTCCHTFVKMNLWWEWRRRDDSVDPIIQEPRPLRPLEYSRPSSPRRPNSPELNEPRGMSSPRQSYRGESPSDRFPRDHPRPQIPQGGTSPSSSRPESPDLSSPKRFSNPRQWRRGDGPADPLSWPKPDRSGDHVTALPNAEAPILSPEPHIPSPWTLGRFSNPKQWRSSDGCDQLPAELPGPEPRVAGLEPVSPSPGGPKHFPSPKHWGWGSSSADPVVHPEPLRPMGKAVAPISLSDEPQAPTNPSSPRRFSNPKHWGRGEAAASSATAAPMFVRAAPGPIGNSPRRHGSPNQLTMPRPLVLGRPARDDDKSLNCRKEKRTVQKKKEKKLFSKRDNRPDGCCNCCGFCTHALALVLILCGDVAVAIATVFYYYQFGIAVAIGILATIGWIWVTVDMMLGRRGRAAQGFYTCFGLLHAVGIFAGAAVTGLLYFAVLIPTQPSTNGFAPSAYLSLAVFFWALPVPYLCTICFDCVGTSQLLKWTSTKERMENF